MRSLPAAFLLALGVDLSRPRSSGAAPYKQDEAEKQRQIQLAVEEEASRREETGKDGAVMPYQFTCAVCGKGFNDRWAKRHRVVCSAQCRAQLQIGLHFGPMPEGKKTKMAAARVIANKGRNDRHAIRRLRPQPNPEQLAALIREWILDMRASEKLHCNCGTVEWL